MPRKPRHSSRVPGLSSISDCGNIHYMNTENQDQAAIEIADPAAGAVEPKRRRTHKKAGAGPEAVPVDIEVDEEIEPEDAPAAIVTLPDGTVLGDGVNIVTLPVASPASVPSVYAVVGGGAYDEVKLSAVVYKNPYARKSLSVHHVQRRLNELGYPDAYADRDGWVGDLTRRAIAEFQRDHGLANTTGEMDGETLKLIFDGDQNVRVLLS